MRDSGPIPYLIMLAPIGAILGVPWISLVMLFAALALMVLVAVLDRRSEG